MVIFHFVQIFWRLRFLQSLTNMQSLTKSGRGVMATMTIRDVDDQLKARLRVQAASHRHSMEEEARDILRAALSSEPARGASLVQAIRERIAPLGGIELELPAREAIRTPPELEA
jgi:plasmid stability protein